MGRTGGDGEATGEAGILGIGTELWGLGGMWGKHRRVPKISSGNCSDLPLPETENIRPPKTAGLDGELWGL